MRHTFFASVALVAAIQSTQPAFVEAIPVSEDFDESEFTQWDSAIDYDSGLSSEHEQLLVQTLLDVSNECELDSESMACAQLVGDVRNLLTSIYNLEIPSFSAFLGSAAMVPVPPAS